jgi:hypothetical protein
MRITKQALVRRWTLSTLAATIVFAVLAWSDWRLKALSGVATSDLQGFNTAVQYHWAFPALAGALCGQGGFQLGPGLSVHAALRGRLLLFRHPDARGFRAPA